MSAFEYEPLSDDAKAAIRECRYKSANMAHTWALLIDTREEIFDRIGLGRTWYERYPGVREAEAQTANPEIVALCVELNRG